MADQGMDSTLGWHVYDLGCLIPRSGGEAQVVRREGKIQNSIGMRTKGQIRLVEVWLASLGGLQKPDATFFVPDCNKRICIAAGDTEGNGLFCCVTKVVAQMAVPRCGIEVRDLIMCILSVA